MSSEVAPSASSRRTSSPGGARGPAGAIAMRLLRHRPRARRLAARRRGLPAAPRRPSPDGPPLTAQRRDRLDRDRRRPDRVVAAAVEPDGRADDGVRIRGARANVAVQRRAADLRPRVCAGRARLRAVRARRSRLPRRSRVGPVRAPARLGRLQGGVGVPARDPARRRRARRAHLCPAGAGEPAARRDEQRAGARSSRPT